MRNGESMKDASKTDNGHLVFSQFPLVYSLFSHILSTSVKYVDLQVRVIIILAGNYLMILGPVNAKC